MGDEKLPWMKFYPGDFMGSGKVQMMSPAERGIYISLLCHEWQEGHLPDDPSRLARVAGATPQEMEAAWPAVRPCFSVDEDGRLYHDRLEAERRDAVERMERRRKMSEAGRKGGKMSGRIRSVPEHLRDRWSEMLRELDGTCPRCRRHVGVEGLTLDHIEPQYQGGEDVPGNIQPLCKPCNSAKGPESIDWMQRWRNGEPGRKGGGSNASTVPPSDGSSPPSSDGYTTRGSRASDAQSPDTTGEQREEATEGSSLRSSPSGEDAVVERSPEETNRWGETVTACQQHLWLGPDPPRGRSRGEELSCAKQILERWKIGSDELVGAIGAFGELREEGFWGGWIGPEDPACLLALNRTPSEEEGIPVVVRCLHQWRKGDVVGTPRRSA